MTKQEIAELAAILVNEHGQAALEVAEQRRDLHAREPRSDAFQLWSRIVEATGRLLRAAQPETLGQDRA